MTANTLTALPTGALSISGNGIVQLADGVTNQTFVTPGTSALWSPATSTSRRCRSPATARSTSATIASSSTTAAREPTRSHPSPQWIANGFSTVNRRPGPAIISSDIAADDAASGFSYGIGYADGADGVIAGLPSGEIEIMFTLLGDANLDGTVNSEDFTPFSTQRRPERRRGMTGTSITTERSTAEDFTPFSHDLNQSAAGRLETGVLNSPLAVSNGISLTNVPEPATAGTMVMTGLGILRRRRRSSRRAS